MMCVISYNLFFRVHSLGVSKRTPNSCVTQNFVVVFFSSENQTKISRLPTIKLTCARATTTPKNYYVDTQKFCDLLVSCEQALWYFFCGVGFFLSRLHHLSFSCCFFGFGQLYRTEQMNAVFGYAMALTRECAACSTACVNVCRFFSSPFDSPLIPLELHTEQRSSISHAKN